MAQIGSFTRTVDGFMGRISTFTLNAVVTLKAVEGNDGDNAPNYRILANGADVGAAWKRTGDKAGEYISLLIDDPSFPQPIRANLFQSGNDDRTFNLLWNRPTRRADRD